MKRPDSLEWIKKAEQDYLTAITMSRKRSKPVPDVVGFHCQQCIEKYLKAFLTLVKIDFPKTHDLLELLEITLVKEPMFEVLRIDLRTLNPFSVQFRYPGESANIRESKKAVEAMQRTRKFFRKRLSL